MSEFDDIRKRIGRLDERLKADAERQAEKEAVRTGERAGQAASARKAEGRNRGTDGASPKGAPDEPDRGPVYWFFYHLRRRTIGAFGRFMRRRPGWAFLLILVLLYALVTGRGWYQEGVVFVRRYALLGLAGIVVLGLLWRWFRHAKPLGKLGAVLTTAVLTAVVLFWGVSMVNYMALYVHYNSVSKVALADLPISGHERIQPLNAIATLAAQEAMDETESATLPHYIRRADGRFDFSMAVGPSPAYPLQRLTRNVDEVISVPATAPAPDFSAPNRHEVVFDVGEKLLFSKNVYTAAVKRFGWRQFFTHSPDEVRYLDRGEGDWVQVVSLIHWRGIVFPRPAFGGVMVLEPREDGAEGVLKRIFLGMGTWYSPEAVRNTDWLRGQNLVPERVSRFTAESFRFHRGFLAPLPGYREGDIRIPDLPEDQNAMPFVTWFRFDGASERAQPGLYHYFGMEPYEATKQGLNLSLFVPGDGEETVYFLDHHLAESGYFGSSAVPVKVRESRKNFDWNNNAAVESRPYIREVAGERRFFWLTTVVTKDDREGERFIGGSIPDLTLTDARHRQVVWIDRSKVADPETWKAQLQEELGAIWGIAPADAPATPPASNAVSAGQVPSSRANEGPGIVDSLPIGAPLDSAAAVPPKIHPQP